MNDTEELKRQGEKSLYESKVLNLEKSSDKKSIILSKSEKMSKTLYKLVTQDEKLIKKAYVYYQKNDLINAKKLFTDAYMVNPNEFVAPLYLSYISEYNFKKSKKLKDLKEAKYWAKKAEKVGAFNDYVVEQNKNIENLLIAFKAESKSKKK